MVSQGFNKWVNKKVSYECGVIPVAENRELSQFLVEKKKTSKGQDSEDIKQKILSISYTDWEKIGFSKGTLYYMKKDAKAAKPFTLNAHVRKGWRCRKGD